jgi:hypothetical protein
MNLDTEREEPFILSFPVVLYIFINHILSNLWAERAERERIIENS